MNYEDRIHCRREGAIQCFCKASEGGPVVVTRNGKPVAVLVGVTDEDEIERMLMAHSPRLRANLDNSRRQIREGLGISHQEFWTQVEAHHPKSKSARAKSKKAS